MFVPMALERAESTRRDLEVTHLKGSRFALVAEKDHALNAAPVPFTLPSPLRGEGWVRGFVFGHGHALPAEARLEAHDARGGFARFWPAADFTTAGFGVHGSFLGKRDQHFQYLAAPPSRVERVLSAGQREAMRNQGFRPYPLFP